MTLTQILLTVAVGLSASFIVMDVIFFRIMVRRLNLEILRAEKEREFQREIADENYRNYIKCLSECNELRKELERLKGESK